MKNEILRSVRRHSLLLGLFAAAAALIVGLVHELTREEIAQQRQAAERRALYEVLPPAAHDNDLLADTLTLAEGRDLRELDLLGLRGRRHAFIARLGGEVAGVILPLEVHDGYSGDISLLVGIRADGRVSGVRVLTHRETPGLGDKIELRVDNWILGFDGRALSDPPEARWTVRRDGGDFDQFVGATITPRAVTHGVRRALRFFELNREALLSP